MTCWLALAWFGVLSAHAAPLTLAAASSLRDSMNALVQQFEQQHPEHPVRVVYGSSGKLASQIMHGAPYDIFFSAHADYSDKVVAAGLAGAPPMEWAEGRLVLWHPGHPDLKPEDLSSAAIRHIAIAQPRHAPYGKAAMEVLTRLADDQLQQRLVFGENVGHATQMVQSGAAEVGLIALSVVRGRVLRGTSYTEINPAWYQPLKQTLMLTRQGANHASAQLFLEYLEQREARDLFADFGYLPLTQNGEPIHVAE
ncbi:molybdate ABC transporter substrate-binding protein [Pseudidiomarina sp.]|uniref:molybdate ABC transporter substrate-binding protein n=1 Tax=Pseudidiomarina sp. TaxID=2081707 RepID=UPI00299DF7EE|nr:molybdate ABC transporter substrate-binding protein [Pseudidiomarina sp.]MDX1705905.1 molybdate ABC transporter substrate-binding protein [Pseudidiomarina sp.]